MKQLLTYFFLITSVFICHSQTSLNTKEKEVITQEIKKMLDNYHTDIVKDGIEDELKYLDSSSDFFWVPPGYKSAISYDSVKTVLTVNAPTLKSVEFKWMELKVNPLSENIVSYTGIVGGSIRDTANQVSTVSMIETGTVLKRADGWKILCGQSRHLPGND